MAAEGEKWVVPMLEGNVDKNLGTTLRKIIRRAGVEPWPKPFQNCRSSRQTELEQQFPTYVVCAWLGNTPTVAHKHYLTVTEEHFATATTIGDKRGTQTPVLCRSDSQEKTRTVHQVPEYASFSEVVGILENAQVAEEGLEGGPFSMVKAPLFHHDGAKSGAVPDDLLWVIEAWPKLNESTKADMIAMVRAE